MSARQPKEKVITNLFVIFFSEILLFYGGIEVIDKMYPILLRFIDLFNVCGEFQLEFLSDMVCLSLDSVLIIICLLYMRVTDPLSIKCFHLNGKKGVFKLLKGLLLGFIVNSLVSVIAIAGNGMTVVFRGIHWYQIVILPFCFIQSSSEEVLLRGYVSEYTEKRYTEETGIFVGSVLFVLHHISNLEYYGFSWRFCLNIFLAGCLLSLLVKSSGSIYTAFGFHTAWNYTQEYMIGLPNSGNVSSFSLFQVEHARDDFFFDPVYGNEGSLLCTLIFGICIVMLLQKRRKSKA